MLLSNMLRLTKRRPQLQEQAKWIFSDSLWRQILRLFVARIREGTASVRAVEEVRIEDPEAKVLEEEIEGNQGVSNQE